MANLKKALLSVVGKAIFRSGTVSAVEELGTHFVQVTVRGPELQRVRWVPGDKVQLDVGGWELRTFTPVEWDEEQGELRFIGYLHGDSTPAVSWLRGLEPGAPCQFFGPRRSLDVSGTGGRKLVIGDESSVGLALALRQAASQVFEVSEPEEAREVLGRIGLGSARVVKREAADAHLPALEAAIRETVSQQGELTLVWSGRAKTIQTLRARLRSAPAVAAPVKVKAYWAEGKRGLD